MCQLKERDLKMKKITSLILILILTMSMFTACAPKEEVTTPPYPVTVMNTVIDREPKVVASLSPLLTQILVDLGYQEKMVGYSNTCNVAGITDEQRIGTTLEPNLEAIGKQAPEIVFTNVPIDEAGALKLSEVGIKIIVLPLPKSVDELKAYYVDVLTAMSGQVAMDEQSTKVIEKVNADLSFITGKLPSGKPKFLYVASLSPTVVVTPDTLESSVLSLLGDNVAADATAYNVTAEQLATYAPDMILYNESIDVEVLKKDKTLAAMEAVKGGKLTPISTALVTLQTKSLAETVREIATTLNVGTDFTAPPLPPEEPASSEPAKKRFFFF